MQTSDNASHAAGPKAAPPAVGEGGSTSLRTTSPRAVMAVSLLPGTWPLAATAGSRGAGVRAVALTFLGLRVGDLQVAVGRLQLLSPHNLLL